MMMDFFSRFESSKKNVVFPIMLVGLIALLSPFKTVQAQGTGDGRALTIHADVQEADQRTGVITARGNVFINYPARQIQATAAQAQYFDRERRMVLTGNVYILQEGNSIRAESVTYLIDEGRFVATPRAERQVESIYIVSDPEAPVEGANPTSTLPFNPKPAFKTPVSEP